MQNAPPEKARSSSRTADDPRMSCRASRLTRSSPEGRQNLRFPGHAQRRRHPVRLATDGRHLSGRRADMMLVLDTNVILELRKAKAGNADRGVVS